ncbi:MAG: hypothetical protein J1F65_02500 [Clostridiales bacterium]|nr:hypothetical protein [Clostridiales bacterium]
MANKKSESKKSESSNKKSTTVWSLNKISFYLIVAMAILYLIAAIFSAVRVDVLAGLARVLMAVASAVATCVVAVLGWRYVRGKQTVWKVLYFVTLLVVLVGLVLPNILLW